MDEQSTGDGVVRARPDRFGFWVAVLTVVFGLVALGIAVSTTPRAGPFCPAECLDYPYAGAAALVPRDFLWMYPATVMLLTYLILTIVVLAHAVPDRRLPAMIAAAFALLAVATLVVDYAIELAVVQPSLLAGESDGVALVSQYNPHGVFIALENVGYVALAVAFVFLSRVVTERGWLILALRWLLLVAGALTLVALVVMSWWFGMDLGYRFEVVAISITWIAVIASSALLAVWLRRPAGADRGAQER
jgi:hypothetical protein